MSAGRDRFVGLYLLLLLLAIGDFGVSVVSGICTVEQERSICNRTQLEDYQIAQGAALNDFEKYPNETYYEGQTGVLIVCKVRADRGVAVVIHKSTSTEPVCICQRSALASNVMGVHQAELLVPFPLSAGDKLFCVSISIDRNNTNSLTYTRSPEVTVQQRPREQSAVVLTVNGQQDVDSLTSCPYEQLQVQCTLNSESINGRISIGNSSSQDPHTEIDFGNGSIIGNYTFLEAWNIQPINSTSVTMSGPAGPLATIGGDSIFFNCSGNPINQTAQDLGAPPNITSASVEIYLLSIPEIPEDTFNASCAGNYCTITPDMISNLKTFNIQNYCVQSNDCTSHVECIEADKEYNCTINSSSTEIVVFEVYLVISISNCINLTTMSVYFNSTVINKTIEDEKDISNPTTVIIGVTVGTFLILFLVVVAIIVTLCFLRRRRVQPERSQSLFKLLSCLDSPADVKKKSATPKQETGSSGLAIRLHTDETQEIVYPREHQNGEPISAPSESNFNEITTGRERGPRLNGRDVNSVTVPRGDTTRKGNDVSQSHEDVHGEQMESAGKSHMITS